MRSGDADSIGRLLRRVAPVRVAETCGSVQRRFAKNPDLLTVAVVDGQGVPVGLLNRQDLFVKLADRFGWALYEKKPVTALMDPAPLIVESDVHFEHLSQLIVSERPSALLTGFIVTEGGRYRGVGTALSLMQMTVAKAKARNVELECAREEAVAASGAKSRFLANMSHELRTPLNAIIGFSDMIRQQVYGALGDGRYRQYADDIQASGLHLLQVINDILDLSKVEAGKLEPRFEEIDLSGILRGAIRMFEAEARTGGLSVECGIPHDLPAVRADPKMVRQILNNLISNAVKFTEPGGIVSVQGTDRDGYACIVVRDSGIGIEPDQLPIVIEPFGQVDNGLNRRYNGTGLGLPLTRALVLAHGGSFRIESRKGVGTSVFFSLPCFQAAAAAPALPNGSVHEAVESLPAVRQA